MRKKNSLIIDQNPFKLIKKTKLGNIRTNKKKYKKKSKRNSQILC